MKVLDILLTIIGAIGTMWTVLCAYKAIFIIVGFFKYRRFKPTENKHKFGICIPARNEEKVIKNLLDSIANQNYPLDRLTVFVLADNCTDKTAEIARNYENKNLNIVVYEHNNPNERTKGFGLKYLFEQIAKDYEHGVEEFVAYFVFDSDNVIKQNYIEKMNEAFDEGNKIVVSFRNSKNLHQNWISFSYGMHWMRTCLQENRGKSYLNQACRIQGTGFLFSNELVKNGWIYTSLTEDRSFCTDAVVQNYRISYCEEAEFYDEQPYKLKVALRQRIRWAKGHLQSAVENCPKLIGNMFKKDKTFTTAYDCFWLNFPRTLESVGRTIVKFALQLIIAIHLSTTFGFLKSFLISYIAGVGTTWLAKMAEEVYILIMYRKHVFFEKVSVWKTIFNFLMFPFFDYIGRLSMIIAVFKKVEWKTIPHDSIMDISKLEANDENKKTEAQAQN